MTSEKSLPSPGRNNWGPAGRVVVFVLASSSIGSLLSDFYGASSMRAFAQFVFMPAMLGLLAAAGFDRAKGDQHLYRAVLMGLIGGLLASVAYDVFRLPFVFAKAWGIDSVVPQMNLFKVFPRFGAMILRQAVEQSHYSSAAQIIGWLYHFSNGATFGVMYIALIGDPARRHWCWAVLFAVALELGMLFTPYPSVFGIPLTARFVVVTLAAHAIFGVALGLLVRRFATAVRSKIAP
jgi:hypothetical protein